MLRKVSVLMDILHIFIYIWTVFLFIHIKWLIEFKGSCVSQGPLIWSPVT